MIFEATTGFSARNRHSPRVIALARPAFFAVLSAVFVSCAGASGLKTATLSIATVGGAEARLTAEIARTESEQEKGYMKRQEIPDGTGMIFVYTQDRQMNFWMKDTPHPLSIAFVASDGSIREIRDMMPFSLDIISSERSVRFALEVPEGWFSRAGVAVGDRLTGESLAAIQGSAAK
jgi:uncharacterized protein